MLEDHLCSKIYHVFALLRYHRLKLFPLSLGSRFQRLSFSGRSVVELIVDIERRHREDFEEGLPVIWNRLEAVVCLEVEGGINIGFRGDKPRGLLVLREDAVDTN